MRIENQEFICNIKKCGTEFWREIVLDCPIPVFVASLKAVTCPKCGSRKIALKLKPRSGLKKEKA